MLKCRKTFQKGTNVCRCSYKLNTLAVTENSNTIAKYLVILNSTWSAIHKEILPLLEQRADENGKWFLEEFTKSEPVVLFMKGTPSSPQCGFSARAAGILKAGGGAHNRRSATNFE